MHPAWEYVVTVFRLWKMHVSGWILAVIAIGLSIAAAIVAKDATNSAMVVKLAAWLSGAAAIWVIFVAQYDAFSEERKKREVAESRNLRPDIRGELCGFDLGDTVTHVRQEDEWSVIIPFRCTLTLCNYSPAETNLSSLLLDASATALPIEFWDLEYCIGIEL
jgi:hypothetical protein